MFAFPPGRTGNYTVPSGTKAIDDFGFETCKLSSVTITQGVESIGFSAFYSCSDLQSVTIPSSVNYTDSAVFADCSSLKTVSIPDSLTTVKDQTFLGMQQFGISHSS